MMGFGRGRGGVPGGLGMQYTKNQYFNDDDYDDEDGEGVDEYGMEYYEEDSNEDPGFDPDYLKNVPPGALFQGGNVGQPAFPQQSAINKVSGVPFYNQPTSKVGVANANNFMMGQPPAASGGGYTYGMMGKQGNLFGPPTTAPAQNTFGVGGIGALGSVGALGGIGGSKPLQSNAFPMGGSAWGAGLGGGTVFGAGSMGGGMAVAENDPYANIQIDISKVKKMPMEKPYEQKTEEEKKQDQQKKAIQASATGATKSSMKTEEDKKEPRGRKRSVTLGNATVYEFEREDESGEFNNKDVNEGGRGSPRPSKKVVEVKDLSDGRNEKERIKDLLDKQEREQLEEIKRMSEWKPQKNSDDSSSEDEKSKKKPIEVSKKSPQKPQIEDSLGNSSSISNSQFANLKKKVETKDSSYESDTFEDISASGSGTKQALQQWKDQKKQDIEVSTSLKQEEDKNVYDAGLMDAYLKKQQQTKQVKPGQSNKEPVKAVKTHDESDPSYEDDFESISKSQSGITNSLVQSPNPLQRIKQEQNKVFDYKNKAQSAPEFKGIKELYVKKENVGVQTDKGKYDYIEPTSQIGGANYKEWSLQQNLKDAEELIQELKATVSDQKQKIFDIEESMKKKDVEFQTQKRELLNSNESFKRLQDQYKDAVHKVNLYKIEMEELIKQIDLADAKAREKEDELKLTQIEYDRKLKQQEDRILFRRSKQDERDTFDLKREHAIAKEEIQKKLDEKSEELDYYVQKVAKIEAENKNLRLSNNQNKLVKELQEQIDLLKAQLNSNHSVQQENLNLKNIKNDLSKEDQIKLQRELQHLEIMVKGYQDESEKQLHKVKQLEKDLKNTQDKAQNESKKVKELQQKALLDKDKVYVEDNKEELDIKTVNSMGIMNAITQKELQELHAQLKKLHLEKSDLERDLSLKDGQSKALTSKVRDEKSVLEKQLYETEFLVGEKEREIQKLKEDILKEKEQLGGKVKELEDKVSWFRENQKLLDEDDDTRNAQIREYQNLKEKVKKQDEDLKKTRDLEKKCKLLEETIKAKNPNSIPMLIQATQKASENESLEKKQLSDQVKRLEVELEDKDKEYEKRIRTLRQEQERMKQLYEQKKGVSEESKKIQELEQEVQNTKNYYNKRIREIEDKYKFRIDNTKDTKVTKDTKDTKNAIKPPQIEKNIKLNVTQEDKKDAQVSEQMDQLVKERNFLAQKVVNLESANNKRRQSFSEQQPIASPGIDSTYIFKQIAQHMSLIKQLKKDDKQLAISVIDIALPTSDPLKHQEPQKHRDLYQNLSKLREHISSSGQINDKLVSFIESICKNELGPDHQLKHQNSAQIQEQFNKDLSLVIDKEVSSEKKQKEVHPFLVEKQVKTRNFKDIFKLIIQSGIDIEKLAQDNGIKKNKLGINQLYTILKTENALKTLNLDEIKSLNSYVKQHAGIESEDIGGQEEIDLQDLQNVMMDISLEFGQSEQKYPERYSYDQGKSVKNNSEEINTLKQQHQEEKENFQQQIQQIQRLMSGLKQENSELQQQNEKVESSKSRLERIIKQSMKGSLKSTGGHGPSDIIDEVGLVMKRLEHLEQQHDERGKLINLDHSSCKRQIQQLMQQIEDEKAEKQIIVAKKNQEISYFKTELDVIVGELKNKMGKSRK